MTSLAILLRISIEHWAAELRQSPLQKLAKRGELTPRALALYLESLRYLLHHSERNVMVAAARSQELGLGAVVEYFERKASEEQGHDSWASDDLALLPKGLVKEVQPAPSAIALTNLQRPLCFVAYILWAEYFTVLLGDEWLAALATCGYERSQVSAVAKHVEADREHAARGFDELDGLWKGQPASSVVLGVVEEAKRLFEAFCDEICSEARL
jgi:hypothetical protein